MKTGELLRSATIAALSDHEVHAVFVLALPGDGEVVLHKTASFRLSRSRADNVDPLIGAIKALGDDVRRTLNRMRDCATPVTLWESNEPPEPHWDHYIRLWELHLQPGDASATIELRPGPANPKPLLFGEVRISFRLVPHSAEHFQAARLACWGTAAAATLLDWLESLQTEIGRLRADPSRLLSH